MSRVRPLDFCRPLGLTSTLLAPHSKMLQQRNSQPAGARGQSAPHRRRASVWLRATRQDLPAETDIVVIGEPDACVCSFCVARCCLVTT